MSSAEKSKKFDPEIQELVWVWMFSLNLPHLFGDTTSSLLFEATEANTENSRRPQISSLAEMADLKGFVIKERAKEHVLVKKPEEKGESAGKRILENLRQALSFSGLEDTAQKLVRTLLDVKRDKNVDSGPVFGSKKKQELKTKLCGGEPHGPSVTQEMREAYVAKLKRYDKLLRDIESDRGALVEWLRKNRLKVELEKDSLWLQYI